MVVVGHCDTDIQGLAVIGIAQDASHPDEPFRFVLRERGERDVVDAVDRVDQMPQRGPAENAWGGTEPGLL